MAQTPPVAAAAAAATPSTPAGTPRHAQQPPTALPDDIVAQRMNDSPQAQAVRRVQALDEKTPTPEVTHSSPRSPASEGTHSPVVPQYPYNTSLAPFLGLGTSNNNNVGGTPDDSEVTTNLPSVQVDYLSHDWSEEDVWASWRATTKHKANIVNGLRLENASWRTWNKQRNNLKTISPETLNWLKDSDVTWLYGPLHTGQVDPNPRPKNSGTADRLGLEDAAPRPRASPKAPKTALAAEPEERALPKKPASVRRRGSLPPRKPILKYRSLSDILTVPSLKHRQYSYELDDGSELSTGGNTPTGVASPRAPSPEDSGTEEADDDKPIVPGGRRRHIAFANRVEQCIAVDSDEDRERYSAHSTPAWSARSSNMRGSYFNRSSSSESSEADEDAIDDSSDDDSQVLTVRSSRPPVHQQQSQQHLHHHYQHQHQQNPQSPPTTEHYTIAKLAPTVLKSSESLPVPSPQIVYSPESSAAALPEEPLEPAAAPQTSSSAASVSAPHVSSPLVNPPVRSASTDSELSSASAAADASFMSDDSADSALERYGVTDREGDYDFEDAPSAAAAEAGEDTSSSSASTGKAAIPTAKVSGDGVQVSTSPSTPSAYPNKGATPSKSILKKSAPAEQLPEPTGSETDSLGGASDSAMSSPASSVSDSAGPTPAFSSTGAPAGASEPLKAEYETRGRPVVRTSSGSSLDGRSASRNPSLGSSAGSGSASGSPVMSTDQSAAATATASAQHYGQSEQPLKGSGEDLQRRSLRLSTDGDTTMTTTTPSMQGASAASSGSSSSEPSLVADLPSLISHTLTLYSSSLPPTATHPSKLFPAPPSELPAFGEQFQGASLAAHFREAVSASRDVVSLC